MHLDRHSGCLRQLSIAPPTPMVKSILVQRLYYSNCKEKTTTIDLDDKSPSINETYEASTSKIFEAEESVDSQRQNETKSMSISSSLVMPDAAPIIPLRGLGDTGITSMSICV